MGHPMGGALAAGPGGGCGFQRAWFPGGFASPFGWFLKVSRWMSYYIAAS